MAESTIAALVTPVVHALAKAGLSQQELLTGPLQYTDLMWQAPPLHSEATVNGIALYHILDRPRRVNVDRLYDFWSNVLSKLRNAPQQVLDREGFKQTSYVIQASTQGERQLAFAMPDGHPFAISEYAAVSFSLECAHLLHTSCGTLTDFVSDDSNYFAVTREGYEIGVRDGLPIQGAEEWDMPCIGSVPALLAQTRGQPYVGCDYDLLAKLRSALWERQGSIAEFEGLDLALQTLRVLGQGRHLPEVQRKIVHLKADIAVSKHRISVIKQANELVGLFAISDRARIKAIRSLLVPDFMSATEFKAKIYYLPSNIPATITEAALAKMKTNLAALLEEEKKRAI